MGYKLFVTTVFFLLIAAALAVTLWGAFWR